MSLSLSYFVVEAKRLDGGMGFGVLLSWDGFKGVSVVCFWWMFNVGFRTDLI